jgi:ATP-dependent Clp protease ATP-binding subunit ClpC
VAPIEAPLRTKKKDSAEPDPAPTLEAVAEDWVAMARAGRLVPTVGIDPVYDKLAALLDDKRLPSLLLVGPRGAGKTTLVRRIARGLLERGRGKTGRRRRLWATSADRIVAGMVYLGMWQQRCLQIVHEIEDTDDVLFVDRLTDMLAPMADGASIADLLAPAVIAGELSIVAECDEAELVRARQRFPALVDSLRVVRIAEATPPQVVSLLEPYGQRTTPHIALSHDAAKRLVELLAAFRRDTAFPGKALAFVDYLATLAPNARSLDTPELTTAFASWSGLPVDLLAPERALDTAAIAGELRKGVVGQTTRALSPAADRTLPPDSTIRSARSARCCSPAHRRRQTELGKQLALPVRRCRPARSHDERLVTPGAIARLISPSLVARARRSDPAPATIGRCSTIEKADASAFDPCSASSVKAG